MEVQRRRDVEESISQRAREDKERKYEEDIQKEKTMACEKALEREKIARGIKGTKQKELQLRKMQRMQMEEKKNIEREQQDVDKMWHDVLVATVRRKESTELLEAQRRRAETRERRQAYDAQIASANQRESERVREEREMENRRLEMVRRRMEEDRAEEMQRKKDQKQKNAQNFLEGHQQRVRRIEQEERKGRELDNEIIREALVELRREKLRKRIEMQRLHHEKQVFVENFNRERREAMAMMLECDRATEECSRLERDRADDYSRQMEAQKMRSRELASADYRKHLEERKDILERERRERSERMARVRETTTTELKRQLAKAHEELRKQLEYRSNLDFQRENNLQIMEELSNRLEHKQMPFTREQQMFKDVMETRVDRSPGRISTNPVHPFKRLLDSKQKTMLPSLPGHR